MSAQLSIPTSYPTATGGKAWFGGTTFRGNGSLGPGEAEMGAAKRTSRNLDYEA